MALGLVVAGVAMSWGVAIAQASQLGWWQAPLYLSGLLILGSVLWYRRALWATAEEAEQLQAALLEEEQRLARRTQELNERLQTYHEWMEFPAPIDLTDVAGAPGAPGEVLHRDAALTDQQLADRARQDRELSALLKAKTNELYDHILNGTYYADGRLNTDALRHDAQALVTQVARLYRPQADRPLIETNPGLLIRALHRASLQVLVALDDLPVNLKDRDIGELFAYFSQAIRVYRLLQKVGPYWPYVKGTYYLGQFALGVNPATTGATWLMNYFGQRALKSVARRTVDYHALRILSDVVRIIGHETASVYGGDYRHRDANWLYAVELTDLLCRFPVSRAELQQAFKELGSLPLRSEYDRIFLYRCVASGRSAHPENYRSRVSLTPTERQALATRLERFFGAYVHGVTPAKVTKWRSDVESRLEVKLQLDAARAAGEDDAAHAEALRSLAAFLLDVKQMEPEALAAQLESTQIAARCTPTQLARLADEWLANPPFLFEPADLEPTSPLVPLYLDDLVRLHTQLAPRSAALDQQLVELAGYYRLDVGANRQRLEKHYAATLASQLAPDAPLQSAPLAVARELLEVLPSGQTLQFFYPHVRVETPAKSAEKTAADEASVSGARASQSSSANVEGWLLGDDQHVLLVWLELGEAARVIWRGEPAWHVETQRGLLASSCRVSGGTWDVTDWGTNATLRLDCPTMSTFHGYFGALQRVHAACRA